MNKMMFPDKTTTTYYHASNCNGTICTSRSYYNEGPSIPLSHLMKMVESLKEDFRELADQNIDNDNIEVFFDTRDEQFVISYSHVKLNPTYKDELRKYISTLSESDKADLLDSLK